MYKKGGILQNRRFRNGALLLVLYFAEADTYIAFVKSAATAPGVEAILMPGTASGRWRRSGRWRGSS